MTIVNLRGMAIFGPGSEWLWAMLEAAALSVTGIAIYRQLRAAGAANALNAAASLDTRWSSETHLRMRLAALMHRAAGKPGWPPTLMEIGNFFEDLATLQNHGHLRLEDTWEEWGRAVQLWWALARQMVLEDRARDPALFTGWERLNHRLEGLDRRAGRLLDLNAATVDAWVESQITILIARLTLDQEMRSGVIPAWPIEPGGPDPVAEIAGVKAT